MKKNIFLNMAMLLILLFALTGSTPVAAADDTAVLTDVLTAQDLLTLQGCGSVEISPDGNWIAYTVFTPRTATEKPGSGYRELFLLNTRTKQVKPFITGKVSVRGVSWSPDSKRIGFLDKRGTGKKDKTQVWAIPVDGGEAVQVTFAKNGVGGYQWHPTEAKIAYSSSIPVSKLDEELEEKGYGFIYYEEKLQHEALYLQDLGNQTGDAEKLTENKTVHDFIFSPDGKTIAVSLTDKNLIDHSYMFNRIFLLDIAGKKIEQISKNEGKLGNFAYSPDGKHLAYTAALNRADHATSQIFVVELKSGAVKNLTPPDFRGHVNSAYWKDAKTVVYGSGEGVWPTISQVSLQGGTRSVILNSADSGVTFRGISFSKDFKQAAFSGSSASDPSQLYYWKPGQKNITKLTDFNPWLKKKKLGVQSLISYKARDGWDIEGILIYPADYEKGKTYPLVVLVHGGPEAHYSNGWMSRYAEPGQVLAGKGYAVFYPNYRASTGYGVKFAAAGLKDPAGKEFDDVADGIDHLVQIGVADRDRVGLGGGSYGGYAAAWFGSYYTKYVRAVCMFVGISNLISKRGTTDIPYEEMYVHSGDSLENQWELDLKRSPVYWAHQSKSAVLIFGGAADTRVHPEQSIQFFRRLKMNNHPAVRLVQYPGEGHGNRRHPGQIDVLHRTLQWYDWYVKEKKDLNGPMPPLDISADYGLELKK